MGKGSSTKRRLSNQDGLMGGADNVQPSNLPKSMDSRKKQYKGVRMRSWGSWVSEIRAPNQKTRIWLGSYATPEAAARAYDAALLCLKGSSANLNFPITSSAYFPDTLLSPKSIQRVAAAAANATPATPPSPPPAPPIPSWSPSPSSSWDTHDEFIAPAPPNPSFSSSSPSPSSWDALDDFTASSSADFAPCLAERHLCSIDPWIDLDALLHSPKYVDHMLNAFAPSGPVSTEECEEEGDIRLWNFC